MITSPRRLTLHEQAFHITLAQLLPWRLAAGVWFCHYPAGGKRTARAGGLLRKLGTRRGVPDLLFVSCGRLFGLELKNGTKGRLSDVQVETHAALRDAGAVVGVAGSIDEAIAILAEWGLLR
jgi:hypothetical protein